MVNTMKSAFKENLPNLKWMSNVSLDAAESKLEQMVDLIGYPEFVLNTSWVDSIYADLIITEGTEKLLSLNLQPLNLNIQQSYFHF